MGRNRWPLGSSPRVWGARAFPCDYEPTARFIPTCVGSAVIPATILACSSVHPHVCGERALRKSGDEIGNGSSPRVWGAPVQSMELATKGRFIPTCVGSAISSSFSAWYWAVHPHVCGERSAPHVKFDPCLGSSPRVWGARTVFLSPSRFPRFIPTCVGSASSADCAGLAAAVHPHVCGERAKPIDSCIESGGSSPRVWGAL